MDPGSLEKRNAEGTFRGHRGARSFSQLRSFYSIETETLFPSVPVERPFPVLLPPSVPSSPFFLPPSSLFPSRRFIFGGRVLDINCPASSQQTHCTTCPNSISNYYSTVDKRGAGKYSLLRGELLMGRKLIKG